MSKVHYINNNHPYKLELVIGTKNIHKMECIATMMAYPMGTAPLNKTLSQFACLFDIPYLIAHNLDIDYLLNGTVIPYDLAETDLTIATTLEILKSMNAENT